MTAPPPRLVLVPRELLDIVLSNADIEIRMSMRPTEHSVALGQIKNLRAMLSSAPEAPSEEDVERVATQVSRYAIVTVGPRWVVIDTEQSGQSVFASMALKDAKRECGIRNARAALAALLAGQPQPTTIEGEPK